MNIQTLWNFDKRDRTGQVDNDICNMYVYVNVYKIYKDSDSLTGTLASSETSFAVDVGVSFLRLKQQQQHLAQPFSKFLRFEFSLATAIIFGEAVFLSQKLQDDWQAPVVYK